MNLCPCGNFLDAQKTCMCSPAVVTKYQKRISGPLLDRIDIHIEVPHVDYGKLSADPVGGIVGGHPAARPGGAGYSAGPIRQFSSCWQSIYRYCL